MIKNEKWYKILVATLVTMDRTTWQRHRLGKSSLFRALLKSQAMFNQPSTHYTVLRKLEEPTTWKSQSKSSTESLNCSPNLTESSDARGANVNTSLAECGTDDGVSRLVLNNTWTGVGLLIHSHWEVNWQPHTLAKQMSPAYDMCAGIHLIVLSIDLRVAQHCMEVLEL